MSYCCFKLDCPLLQRPILQPALYDGEHRHGVEVVQAAHSLGQYLLTDVEDNRGVKGWKREKRESLKHLSSGRVVSINRFISAALTPLTRTSSSRFAQNRVITVCESLGK